MSAREELASLLLHDRIAAVISRAGLTQEAFGSKVGVDRPRVNGWVKGRGGVSPESAEKIAAFASTVYGEELPAELFVSGRRTPLEEAALQLAQTGQAVEAALAALSEIAAHLVPLLEQQEALVLEMQTFVAELRRRGPSSGDVGGLH